MCAIEDKTAVVVVASYRNVSRNPVCFKALNLPFIAKMSPDMKINDRQAYGNAYHFVEVTFVNRPTRSLVKYSFKAHFTKTLRKNGIM